MNAVYQGNTVAVIAKSGGWTTIKLDGVDKKVRNSTLKPAPVVAKKAAKKAKGPTVLPFVLANYVKTKEIKTKTGRTSVDTGDATAVRLRGQSLEKTFEEASKATGFSVNDLIKRYEKLNPGMQRMNLGNLIRGVAKLAK